MDKIQAFEEHNREVVSLDMKGNEIRSSVMVEQYKRRNSFGLDPSLKVHRIFQKKYLDKDMREGYLTLPSASASVWGDDLENPLADVSDTDSVTGGPVDLGSLVRSFHAMCWTKRPKATKEDWDAFSHGGEAVRVSTTVGALLDRIMVPSDPCYMNRTWLIEVDYEDPGIIQLMKAPAEVYTRMDSQGALLALSAAVVRTDFSDEEEVRLLIDSGLPPGPPGMVKLSNPSLIRIPFNWEGFIEGKQYPGCRFSYRNIISKICKS